MDYRYFPDPDLGALVVEPAWRDEVARSLPELPEARALRLAAELGIPAADAELVCLARPLADYFEAAVRAHPKNAKGIANWLLSEVLALVSDADRQAGRLPLSPEHLAALVRLIDDGTISGKIAKELLPAVIETGKAPGTLVEERGLVQMSDEGAIREAVRAVVEANPAQAETFRAGKTAALGWFVGQVMKATGGKANPAVVNRLLKEMLG